ncbi:MAG: dihydropteroate synthase [Elusimicrobiota bacterium]
MFIIGEKINGMFKSVREAVAGRDKRVIRELANAQLAAGANALDVNVGPGSAEPIKDMEWLITSIREVTQCPLAVDTTKPDVMELGLTLAGDNAFLNSVSGDKEKLDILIPLAKKYNSKIVALTMTKTGVPQNTDTRMEIAANIVAAAVEHGYDTAGLYIDPLILPVNVAQPHASAVIETIRQIGLLCDPPPKTVLGLSNVSQGTIFRGLIDRTYLVMAISAGLDAAILNPLDKELMDAMIATELLLGKTLYCDSFLDAYHKK